MPDSGVTPDDIDREIRRLPTMFSAPSDVIAYARRKGLQAEEYNNNSIEQMEDFVNQGIPVMALLDLTPDNALDFKGTFYRMAVKTPFATLPPKAAPKVKEAAPPQEQVQ
jgi:hypothetical protein